MSTAVNDNYLSGNLDARDKHCEVCGVKTRCIFLVNITLPEEVTIRSTILWKTHLEETVRFLGLGCGCYAKFHRQLVHIQESMKRRSHVVT